MKDKFTIAFIAINLLAMARVYGIEDPDSLFRAANEYYKQEQYEKAIDSYLKIYDQGFESAELYFNTANAYFRSNNLGKARLYYERALLLNPDDEDVNANLEYTKSFLTDRFEVVPEFFLRRWIKNLLDSMSSNAWLLLSLAFFGAFLVSASVYIFLPSVKHKKSGFFGGIIFFALTLSTFMFSSRQYEKYEDPGTAVIMDGSLVVKSAPRESGKDLFILHEGTKVSLENSVDSWIEIRITDGRKGWVPIASLEEI